MKNPGIMPARPIVPVKPKQANGVSANLPSKMSAKHAPGMTASSRPEPIKLPGANVKVSNLISVWNSGMGNSEVRMPGHTPKFTHLPEKFVKKRIEDFAKLSEDKKTTTNGFNPTTVRPSPRVESVESAKAGISLVSTSTQKQKSPEVSTHLPLAELQPKQSAHPVNRQITTAARKRPALKINTEIAGPRFQLLQEPQFSSGSPLDITTNSSNISPAETFAMRRRRVSPQLREVYARLARLAQNDHDISNMNITEKPVERKFKLPTEFPEILSPLPTRNATIIRHQIMSRGNSGSSGKPTTGSGDRTSQENSGKTSGRTSASHNSHGSYVDSAARYAKRFKQRESQRLFREIEDMAIIGSAMSHRKKWHSGATSPSGQYNVELPNFLRNGAGLTVGVGAISPVQSPRGGSTMSGRPSRRGSKFAAGSDEDKLYKDIAVQKRLLGDNQWRKDGGRGSLRTNSFLNTSDRIESIVTSPLKSSAVTYLNTPRSPFTSGVRSYPRVTRRNTIAASVAHQK
ncbi:hypothetical protein ABW19_dt0200770 [Dactylella cylindrospora]|nr:hypothetical protein ABW19_dt0200770 [Dactylella cylindrospora]